MFLKKLYLFLMFAAVSVLLVTSVSFSAGTSDVSGSFAVRAGGVPGTGRSHVVQTVASLGVGALTDSLSQEIGKNVDNATKDIKAANTAAEEARLAQQKKAVKFAEEKAAQASQSIAISGVEAEILNLINSTRAAHGLSTLSLSGKLTDLARLRSSDMVSRGYFSHHSPEGTNITHIFSQYGVSYRNFGENLGRARPAGKGSPSAFINAWMNSASHRDNMLKGYYSSIGVGVVDGNGVRVVTVLFIR